MIARSVFCRLLLAFAAGFLPFASSPLFAQDDPFDPFNPNQAPPPANVPQLPAADQPANAAALPLDITTRAIVESNPQTPVELARVIELLLDLDRGDLAMPFVDRLLAEQLADQQWFELYRSAGPDVAVRFGLSAGLGEKGSELSNKIIDGARRYATSDERLTTLARDVLADDTWQRSKALADLKTFGDAGAATLVTLLADGNLEPYWPRIRAAIRQFGDGALGPLVAAWNSNHARLRAEALQALGFIPSMQSVEVLLAPAIVAPEGSVFQTVAARSIHRIAGRLPDKAEAELMLERAARRHLASPLAIDNSEWNVKWWRWDAEGQRLVLDWISPEAAARIRASHCARDLTAINPQRADWQRMYWIARLAAAKLTSGVDQPLPAAIRDGLAERVSPDFLNHVLADAIAQRCMPAATAACELIAVTGDASLLESSGTSTAPLVRALDSGSLRLTHAAARAIRAIDPVSFAGSSRYINSLVYLGRAKGARVAIVAHVNSETARTLAARVAARGFDAIAVTSGRELFERATVTPDLELLVVTDMIGQPGVGELLQTLRAHPRTSAIPVLLLASPQHRATSERLAQSWPRVMASPMIEDDVVMARQVANLETIAPWTDAGPVERLQFSQEALEQLANSARQPDSRLAPELARHETALTELLADQAHVDQTCELLGRIGTPTAQRSLIEVASNAGLPESVRRAAAESFAQAVRARGLMLQRDAIQRQYDRYNASASENQETQQILGYVLDAIEGRLD